MEQITLEGAATGDELSNSNDLPGEDERREGKQGVRGEELPPARRGAALDAGGPAADCGGVGEKPPPGADLSSRGFMGFCGNNCY